MIAPIRIGIGPETIEGIMREAKANRNTPLGRFALDILCAILRYDRDEESESETVYVKPPNKRRWSRRLPRKTGFFWTRTHGGQGVVCWYNKRLNTARTCSGADPEMTEDYRSTQAVEFLPGEIIPPGA